MQSIFLTTKELKTNRNIYFRKSPSNEVITPLNHGTKKKMTRKKLENIVNRMKS